ncbi:MAG: type II toxin-antitoxin system HicA family toxin [Planctomycetota bacterium]|nr:MAG: type II toxin-antitoxin system HicA family toxin [Planctomycetota bacterium]
MIRPDRRGLLSIPMHNPIKRGTMRKLIREAGLTVEEFLKLL